MNYRVCWRDGSNTEDVDYAESMRLIQERPEDWIGVQCMDYAKDCSPENEKIRKAAWGAKTKKK